MSSANFQLAGFQSDFVAGLETKTALLPETVYTKGIANGLTFRFLVADAADKDEVTRNLTGDIPYGEPNRNGYTVTMTEAHAPYELSGFNIFTSQGPSQQIMMEAAMATINRAKDKKILTALATGTVELSASAAPAAFSGVQKFLGKLGSNQVPNDGQTTLLVTPNYHAAMLGWKEFNSAELISRKPLDSGGAAWADTQLSYRWNNLRVVVHPGLPGVGTATETCYIYHKTAVGYAFAMNKEAIEADYEKKQDRSWVRATYYHGATLLQDNALVTFYHDASEYI